MRRRVLFALSLSAALAFVGAGRARGTGRRHPRAGDVGRLRTGGAPIANVSVTATSLNGNVNRNAKTDKDGRYTVTFPEAEGDYFVTFVALGYSPRRIEVKRTADQDILLGDARLSPIGAVLDTVVTTGQRNRNRPVRGATAPDISGTDKSITSGLVPPDQAGDLAAMAATLPGRVVHPRCERRSVGHLGARARPGPEQHVAQWSQQQRIGHSARRERHGQSRDVAVRRVAGTVQRRADQHPDVPGLQLHQSRVERRVQRAAVGVDRPHRTCARPTVHERECRRRGIRAVRAGQGLL